MPVTVSRITADTATVTLFAAATTRRHMLPKMVNDSTAILYFKYGDNCAGSDFTWLLDPGERWVMDAVDGRPEYDGIITGYWASAAGGAQVTFA